MKHRIKNSLATIQAIATQTLNQHAKERDAFVARLHALGNAHDLLTSHRQSLTRIGELAAHPAAFGVLPIYALLWFIFDRSSLDWHAFATLAAVFMTLLIQRAEDRDAQALQAKLDELLRASKSADSGLTKIDTLEPEDIKRIRDEG